MIASRLSTSSKAAFQIEPLVDKVAFYCLRSPHYWYLRHLECYTRIPTIYHTQLSLPKFNNSFVVIVVQHMYYYIQIVEQHSLGTFFPASLFLVCLLQKL